MDFLVNAVKAYFNRSWTRKDMMSLAPIPQKDCTSLNRASLYIPRESAYERELLSLTLACFLMFSTFVVNDLFSRFIDSYTAHLMLKVATMLTLFIGYLVLYSQEILYDARFGHINADIVHWAHSPSSSIYQL
uniref:Uncharacterized protein n=1 Tax=Solanum lycopersicum TaxID=4081 RepID=A0A3Q7EJY1_SOLLC